MSLRWQTAKHALRCLIGCNIGEGVGAAIGFVLGWDMISTLVLAVGLAFAIGYAFTIIPMLKTEIEIIMIKIVTIASMNMTPSKYS